ncbi:MULTISPECIES: transposase [Chryseobacterium]|uniref:transposase n=1 Tax=Chryseobacterium TaxID=59732 RepID=UPI001295EDB7|nr:MULTISPECIES: transposase [Chryseobacterium]MDR6919570.1 hypothetical protein [Chryseobacterium sp. 2987]
MNFKNIHIGSLISQRVAECGIEISRICNFMKLEEKEIKKMYQEKILDTKVLLKWSKLLEHDFFRIYSQHLILYAPPPHPQVLKVESQLPQFRKNIYTKEIIDFILAQIQSEEMSRNQVIEQYKIPKTTLYKWMARNKKQK